MLEMCLCGGWPIQVFHSSSVVVSSTSTNITRIPHGFDSHAVKPVKGFVQIRVSG